MIDCDYIGGVTHKVLLWLRIPAFSYQLVLQMLGNRNFTAS